MSDEKKTGIKIERSESKLAKLLDELRLEGEFGASWADRLEVAINEEFRQFRDELTAEVKQLIAIAEYDDYDKED